MTTRKYSSKAQQTTLASSINATVTSMTVVNGPAVMGGKTLTGTETYTVVIDPDTALEEIVDVTLYSSGNTLTITRGVDSASPGTGSAHSAGAVVRHMAIGRDYQEANNHIEGTLAGHAATTSAQLRGVISDETGTGSLVFATSPTLVTPALGTPASGVLTNTTGLPLTTGVTGTLPVANGGTGVTTSTGSGANVLGTSPTITGLTLNDASIVFEGATADAFETTLTVTDPTADRTITLPNVTGTVVTTGDTGTVTSTMIASDTIVNADINSSAQIDYGKLNLTNTIVDADVNASAAIAWTKIAPSSTVSTTELGYLDGVTSAIQTQLDSKLATATASSTYAPLASPALTGVPTAPTAAANTNTTQVATTAYVQTELTDLIGGAPGALDTLNELAAALADDANYSTTITTALATKLPLAGGTMTGAIEMGTNKITGLGTPTASTDAATKAYADAILVGAPGNLTGPITSVGAVTSIASQTGTGTKFVVDTSPTLVTPNLGVATATSINGTTIPTSKTLVATDSTTYVVPSQTGNSGKYLTTDGTTSSWGTVATPSAATATTLGTVYGKTTTTSTDPVSLGHNALNANTTGQHNTAIGNGAHKLNTTGSQNVAIGSRALEDSTTGGQNVAIGYTALANSTGSSNTAIGWGVMGSNTSGGNNTAVGSNALNANSTGLYNVALGAGAIKNATTGSSNIGLGWFVGETLTTGSNNIIIGQQAEPTSATISNEITLGNSSVTRFRIPGIGFDINRDIELMNIMGAY